jgi:hypothetical protein
MSLVISATKGLESPPKDTGSLGKFVIYGCKKCFTTFAPGPRFRLYVRTFNHNLGRYSQNFLRTSYDCILGGLPYPKSDQDMLDEPFVATAAFFTINCQSINTCFVNITLTNQFDSIRYPSNYLEVLVNMT